MLFQALPQSVGYFSLDKDSPVTHQTKVHRTAKTGASKFDFNWKTNFETNQ